MQDANILIDLELAGILDHWFQLDHETHTTDQITRQLENGGHKGALIYIREKIIIERSFSFEELSEIESLRESCGRGPDFNDCSMLYLAIELGACLLTGDKQLRKESEAREVEVRGILWVFDQIVENNLIVPPIAAERLYLLLNEGSFLPAQECESRIQRWSNL